MEQKYIYLILTQTGTRVSRIIKLFTGAPYNHSSISGDSRLEEMYSFCRYYKHRPLPAGFSQEHVNTCVFGMFAHIPCAIYRIPVSEEQFVHYRNLVAYFKQEKNYYSFNLMGFVGNALKVPIHRKRKFVCSQFVAYMLRESGIHSFKKDLFLITPDDFRFIPQAELWYEGNLRDYYNRENEVPPLRIPRLYRKPGL